MSGLLDKALHALLTDPVSGAPLSAVDRLSLAYGLIAATIQIILIIGLFLNLEPGQ